MPTSPQARRGPAKAAAGTGGRSAALRPSPAASSAEARRRGGELDWSRISNRSSESIARRNALPALSRRAADGAQTRWPQARARHEGTDDDPAGRQPVLELRLRLGHAHRRPRFRILRVIDDFSRECLAATVEAFSGSRNQGARRSPHRRRTRLPWAARRQSCRVDERYGLGRPLSPVGRRPFP